jgi:hypothetical protein
VDSNSDEDNATSTLPIATSVTDSNGRYSFICVEPGNSKVKLIPPDGIVPVTDSDGGIPTEIDVDVTENDAPNNFFVTEKPSAAPSSSSPSKAQTKMPIANAPPTAATNIPSQTLLASISGTVLEDTDNNNIGDVPLQNVPVALLDSSSNLIESTMTDSNGDYMFSGLPEGNCIVVQTNLTGYSDVSDTSGPNDNTIPVSLSSGQNSAGNDFIDKKLGSIKGNVTEDLKLIPPDGIVPVTDCDGGIPTKIDVDEHNLFLFSKTNL